MSSIKNNKLINENMINVAVLYGGRSAEHEISLISAKNVLNAINKDKYNIIEVKIDKKGNWSIDNQPVQLLLNYGEGKIINQNTAKTVAQVEVLYPVLHGPYGEDGTIQALAKIAGLPCVGPNLISSAMCMDKDVCKRVLQSADIKIARFVTLRKHSKNNLSYSEITKYLGNQLFIKPANMGSSVGISFANDEESFNKAVVDAYKYDNKLIVEEKIKGREIECAVLGNIEAESSAPGEIVPTKGFYSYESKYLDEKGAILKVPADLPVELSEKAKTLALKAFEYLECKGMARVDMFLTENGEFIINEINTLPGFTEISMYPKLWDYSGVNSTQLTDQAVGLFGRKFYPINRYAYTICNRRL